MRKILLFLLIPLSSLAQKRQPNFVFIFGDDWGKYASAYSFEKEYQLPTNFKTPNFDSIAKKGVLFTNAFAAAPSCTPSRSSLLSGQYFFNTGMGAILHMATWDAAIPSFPLLLENGGYKIGYSFKVWSPGTPVDAPFGGIKNKFEKYGSNFERFGEIVSTSSNKEQSKQQLLNEVHLNFLDFIQTRKNEQPFFYWFGATNTHRSFKKGSGASIWGLQPDDMKGKLKKFLPDVAEVREDFCDYLGTIMTIDAAIGVLINDLREMGELDNTLIVISGDNGIPGFPRSKTNLYDDGLRVPLAIQWGANVKPGRQVNDLINLMDLAPTFLEIAGLPVPSVMDGKSLLPVLLSNRNGIVDKQRNYIVAGRERHVASAREGNLPYPQRCLITERFLYIKNYKPDRWPIGTIDNGLRDIDSGPTKDWYAGNFYNPLYAEMINLNFGLRPQEELYDRLADPSQINNLSNNPQYNKQLLLMRKKLQHLLVKQKDPRVAADSCVFDKMPYTNISEQLLKIHDNEVKRVNELKNKKSTGGSF